MSEGASRLVFKVVYNPCEFGVSEWQVFRDNCLVKTFFKLKDAIGCGASLARDLHNSEGTPTRLIVYNRSGKESFTRNYGKEVD